MVVVLVVGRLEAFAEEIVLGSNWVAASLVARRAVLFGPLPQPASGVVTVGCSVEFEVGVLAGRTPR